MMTLDEFLRFNGFEEALGLPLDGQFHRFGRNGGASNGWFKGLVTPSGLKVASFGDWKTSERHEWTGDTLENPAKAARALEELRLIELEEHDRRTARQEEVSKECQQIAGIRSGTQLSPYFERKGLSPEAGRYGCWVESESDAAKKFGPQTMVPAYDIDGKLWGIQRRGSDGYRSFKEGMRIKGCHVRVGWHLLEAKEIKRVFLAEGISTAASIFEAFSGSEFVISCFSAGNLKSVAEAVRKQWPAADIIICADNDWETEEKTGENPGIKAAWNAIVKNGQEYVVWPENLEPGESDYNDAHQRLGLPWVKESILKGMGSGAGVPATPGPELPEKKKEDPGPHLEKKLADILLRQLGARMIRQEDTLFAYDDRRWVEMQDAEIDSLKNRINAMTKDKLPSKTVNSVYATFLRYVPYVPKGVNLFEASPAAANFLDGTLHLRRDIRTGDYSTEFLPHNAKDFLTSLIPMNYHVDREKKNALLEALLEEALGGDPDKEDKIKSLQECGGAMLVAAFPQIFIFHGRSGSRKSTLAKVLLKPLQKEGFSMVSFLDPSKMEGFMVEDMIGKLVNANTDIEDFKAFPRGFFKGFEDNLPVQVNRKNKRAVKAKLPTMHLYCANELPPNYERSGAFGRRTSLLKFDKDLDKPKGRIKFYEDLVFESGPDAVLAFMLTGLERLISQGGNFTVPKSSAEEVKAWTEGYNSVASFVTACKAGDVGDDHGQVIVDNDAIIEQGRLWVIYQEWHSAEFPSVSPEGRTRFFESIESRGFNRKRDKKGRYFLGMGTVETPNSVI